MGPLGTPRFFTPVPISVTFVARFLSLIIQMSDVSICQRGVRPPEAPFSFPRDDSGDSRGFARKRCPLLLAARRGSRRAPPISAIKRPRKAAKTGRTVSSALVCDASLRPFPPPALVQLGSSKLEPDRDVISGRGTYIRLRVHAISRSCPHLHAAVIIRPGLRDAMRFIPVPSSWARPRRKPGQGSISRPLYPSPSGSLPSSPRPFPARSGPGGSTRIQLPRQNRPGSLRLGEVAAIYINSRR